jgi:hypothetical protein
VAQGGDGARPPPRPWPPRPRRGWSPSTPTWPPPPPQRSSKASRPTSPPAGLSDEERGAYQQLRGFYATHVAYANIMATGPQTLDGLADSPLQLAAFLLDHGDGTGQPGPVKRVLAGTLQRELPRDDLLDNITLSWLTTTGVSAARLSWENSAGCFDAKATTIPFAISGFPHELHQAPGSWAERAYPGQPPLLQPPGRPRWPLRGLGAAPAALRGAPGRLRAPALTGAASSSDASAKGTPSSPANPLRGLAADTASTTSVPTQLHGPVRSSRSHGRSHGPLGWRL